MGGGGVTEKVEKSCSIKVLPDLLLTGVAMNDLGERLVSPRELFSVSTNWCKKKWDQQQNKVQKLERLMNDQYTTNF